MTLRKKINGAKANAVLQRLRFLGGRSTMSENSITFNEGGEDECTTETMKPWELGKILATYERVF